MLTRDISLIPAVLDLVDNCVDGARGEVGDGPYEEYWVRVELDASKIRIVDNCGGISIETAEKYAFRFGRDDESPTLRHSIGQFGVGMKRAIFKIGDGFRIESRTRSTRFVVHQDIRDWEKQKEWRFHFKELEEGRNFPPERVGTDLTVLKLHTDVASEFAREGFRNQLREELRTKLSGPIAKGLAISLNGQPIHSDPLELIDTAQLAPAYTKREYPSSDDPQVTARFYVGIADGDPASAGWHVFCNGRLILEGDKTAVTGWGKGTSEETHLPRFHGQYNRFRCVLRL